MCGGAIRWDSSAETGWRLEVFTENPMVQPVETRLASTLGQNPVKKNPVKYVNTSSEPCPNHGGTHQLERNRVSLREKLGKTRYNAKENILKSQLTPFNRRDSNKNQIKLGPIWSNPYK